MNNPLDLNTQKTSDSNLPLIEDVVVSKKDDNTNSEGDLKIDKGGTWRIILSIVLIILNLIAVFVLVSGVEIPFLSQKSKYEGTNKSKPNGDYALIEQDKSDLEEETLNKFVKLEIESTGLESEYQLKVKDLWGNLDGVSVFINSNNLDIVNFTPDSVWTVLSNVVSDDMKSVQVDLGILNSDKSVVNTGEVILGTINVNVSSDLQVLENSIVLDVDQSKAAVDLEIFSFEPVTYVINN